MPAEDGLSDAPFLTAQSLSRNKYNEGVPHLDGASLRENQALPKEANQNTGPIHGHDAKRCLDDRHHP